MDQTPVQLSAPESTENTTLPNWISKTFLVWLAFILLSYHNPLNCPRTVFVPVLASLGSSLVRAFALLTGSPANVAATEPFKVLQFNEIRKAKLILPHFRAQSIKAIAADLFLQKHHSHSSEMTSQKKGRTGELVLGLVLLSQASHPRM